MIMGSNIGTSVTNTIVSFTQVFWPIDHFLFRWMRMSFMRLMREFFVTIVLILDIFWIFLLFLCVLIVENLFYPFGNSNYDYDYDCDCADYDDDDDDDCDCDDDDDDAGIQQGGVQARLRCSHGPRHVQLADGLRASYIGGTSILNCS